MVKQGIEIAKAIKPPGGDEVFWWRLTVSGSIIAIAVTVILHVLWSVGAPPFSPESGFAMAGDVNQVLEELRELNINEVEAKVVQAQRDWCTTPPGTQARSFFLERRNMLLNQYVDLTGRNYQGLPTCQEMGL